MKETRNEVVVAVFRSDAFARPWPAAPDRVEEQEPWGKDLAQWLLSALRAEGLTGDHAEPLEGDGTWSFWVRVEKCWYELSVQWAPLGSKSEDRWVVQVSRSRGCLGGLLLAPRQTVEVVVEVLRGVLPRAPGVQDVRWLTEQEFARIY